MLHELTELTMSDLCQQVGEWSTRNFGDKQASDLGVVEELGELTHGILKRYQGIRGFDDPVKFTAHIEDALADTGIYLLNFAGINGMVLMHMDSYPAGHDIDDRKCLSQLLLLSAQLVMFTEAHGPIILSDEPQTVRETLIGLLQGIWTWTATWAVQYNFDLRVITTKTWLKVRERDWLKNRTHAHIVAESGGVEVPTPVQPFGSIPPEPGAVSVADIPVPADSNHYKAADQY